MGKKHKTIVTHLEMLAEPRLPPAPRPLGKYALMRAEKPPVHFYRYLYHEIGNHYVWVNRKRLSDEALASIVQNDEVEIYVLYCGGVPAGFFELDFASRTRGTFIPGVMPEMSERALGASCLRGDRACLGARPEAPDRANLYAGPPRALLYQRHGLRALRAGGMELEEIDRRCFRRLSAQKHPCVRSRSTEILPAPFDDLTSSMKTTRLATAQAHFVRTHSMVMPSRASSTITSRTSLIISGSSAEVGSSNSMIFGFMQSACAIATRCCCPPDS